MPMCSGLDTVLLLFRGLTGSYSHLKPRSRQRSHCGRSSLHFFFFSLLSHSKYVGRYIALLTIGSPMHTPWHNHNQERLAACLSRTPPNKDIARQDVSKLTCS